MDEKTREILTDEKLIEYHEKWFEKMTAFYNGECEERFYLNGFNGYEKHPDALYNDPELWMDEVVTCLADHAYKVISDDCFVPLVVNQWPYGVHFVDRIFGAEVFFKAGQWYNYYLKNEVGSLKKPDLETNETWALGKKIAHAFLDLKLTVPLFSMPVIASVLNIAVNLYGEKILVAMIEEPEAARHDLKIINDVLTELHQWYRAHIPMAQLQPVVGAYRTQPPGHGQICGCTCQLLSPELYEEFIMELDNELLGVYPNGGMIHLCGSHTQLIQHFARMDKLRSVQLNDKAAEDLEYYVNGLRDDQVIYFNPCNSINFDRALEIAKTKNKRVVLVGRPEDK